MSCDIGVIGLGVMGHNLALNIAEKGFSVAGYNRSPDAVKEFLAFVKTTLGEAVAEVRASERLTDSAVCLVAPDSGPDRALERILAGAGRLNAASKPILEVNPRHDTVVALAKLGDGERAFKEDAVHLLFDEARVLDGERPTDARQFSDRLGRVLGRGLR